LKKEENIVKKKVDYSYTRTEEIITWDNLIEENLSIFIQGIRKPKNVIEARDGIQIRSIEKEPFVRQLIDALLICGFDENEKEVKLIKEIEMYKLHKNNNIIVQKDSITISGVKSEPYTRQPINSLFIAGLYNKEKKDEEYRKIHEEVLKSIKTKEIQKKK
jgi:hypothetical protein